MEYTKIDEKYYLTPVRFFTPRAGIYDVNGKIVKLENRIYTLDEVAALPDHNETISKKVLETYPGG